MELFAVIVGVVFVYLLPTVISGMRHHQNGGAIFATNILLGWTFIGWAVALIWACSAVKRNEDDFDRRIRIEKRRNS